MIPRFCIQQHITDREVSPCSVAHLLEVMSSPEIQRICDDIKLLDGRDDEELSRLKRHLPVITPHAQSFTHNERKNTQAVPSGLVMLDIDDIGSPREMAARVSKETLQSVHIYFVAITPSGHGLRVIGERHPGESIAEGQARLASLYGVAQYDASTKDLARASFVMPYSYLLHIDEAGLEFASATEAQSVAQTFTLPPESPSHPPQEATPTLQESQPTTYHDIPYADIISQLITLLGGSPEQGERNTFYFTLVRYARYICDFNPEFLLSVLPDFGLSASERQQVISSAVHRPRKSVIPDTVQRAITLAQINRGSESPQVQGDTSHPNTKDMLIDDKGHFCFHLSPHTDAGGAIQERVTTVEGTLPRVLELICRRLPAPFRPAMVIASLPVLGTLATRVRFDYLDHQEHSFSFMSMITAPAATGKSFIRRPVNLLLTPVDEQDEVEREKEQEYKEKLRAAKNAKMQPDNPRACPRNNGINISIAKLLQLLSYSEGKHLIGIGEEIDTLVKSEKAGVWSQKSDIYRLAFDNAHYGQNYMSDNSFSANVPVYYNLLLTGTPNGMYRFFKDVEDGLVTRWAFAQLPDMFGTEIPDFQPYTSKEETDIIQIARSLDMSSGKIHCQAVDEAILEWLEQKRQMAIANDSRAIDTIRRRAAVMGFRAGYLAALLNGSARHTKGRTINKISSSGKVASVNNKSAASFALYVAEYIFRTQLTLFGEKIESVCNEWVTTQERKGSVKGLLYQLPEDFSRADLMALRARNGKSTDVRMILSRWTEHHFIRRNADGSYHKIDANYV